MSEKILIIDETGFSRICSAILEFEGYNTETVTDFENHPAGFNNGHFRLIITSYPYGSYFLDEIRSKNIPTIILSDNINGDLINILEGMDNSYCMIKPLDYQKFRYLVRQVMNGDLSVHGGYNIV